MPVYEFECQECGEIQTAATPAGVFEVHPEPCNYCNGTVFKKLVGTVAVSTEEQRARTAKIDTALVKEEAQSGSCPQCGNEPGMEDAACAN